MNLKLLFKKVNLSNALTYGIPLLLGIQDKLSEAQTIATQFDINIPQGTRLAVAGGSLVLGCLIKILKFLKHPTEVPITEPDKPTEPKI
jgi:hypothetical protein